ncbi:MAG: hypothetical protein AB8C95_11240 [Phycisphaeraceae bacterium]
MTYFRGFWVFSFLLLLLCASSTNAQTWQNDRYHLSMEQPTDWPPMSKALLAQANAQISHITGRGFIAGFALNESDTLVFPYMLVQFKPYAAMPKQYRPAAKLDEQGRLQLLYALVGAFREQGRLPETIDTPQFIDRFRNKHAQLTRLEDDGRFDFTGKIPHKAGQVPIQYHTHGMIGKDGIAMVSVFSVEDFSGLTYVIQNGMRTLAFDTGFGGDALPAFAPRPDPVDEATPPATSDGRKPEVPVSEAVIETAENALDAEESETVATVTTAGPGRADSTALIIILCTLGAGLIAVAMIVWLITHQKAKAQRERRRIRMERLHASQRASAAAPVQPPPRPAAPVKGQSRGSNDRQRHGTTPW